MAGRLPCVSAKRPDRQEAPQPHRSLWGWDRGVPLAAILTDVCSLWYTHAL